MNYHQTIEDILKAATPEQKILWNFMFLQFGERLAASQLYYCGAIAGSEFVTFVARKLYLYYQIEVNGLAGSATPGISLFNEINVQVHAIAAFSSYWDVAAAAPRASGMSLPSYNGYFSRIAILGGSTQFKIIGYRITY